MTQASDDLTIRPIAGPDELDLFCRLPYVLNAELAGDLSAGRRRPEWLWVALRGDRLVGRLAWWAVEPGRDPYAIDIVDVDDADTGVRLLEAAFAAGMPKKQYIRFVPPDWREGPTPWREALERLGAKLFVERLRLEWRPGTPIPEPTGRLRFREVGGRDELMDLLARVLDGTLDAHSRSDLTSKSAAEVAAEQCDDEFPSYKGPRDWWRVATTPDGDPVGFVIPSRNSYNPIIAYIGVVPQHRGRGYIDEILAEGTRILAAQDVPRIRAATDVGNVPMAKSFARLGYLAFEHQVDMTWD
ncbi:GNAT family N-acetyltransferase [Allorhizocola rhizosphaerae]|uniref:GNAT family N-acetyltransferase n=1 Tax=Allorhizocola rhizosphaerae TaxID=1872709 RepID=UPI000E3E045D|nr:GNAT family N-acetyltransferase [Allorhizocola rhizosphaerae]